jgi:membrane protein implicated in regulation of membrane protease activity
VNGLTRFFICWVIASAISATVFMGWKYGPMSFVFSMFDPVGAVLAAVAAFVWSKVAKKEPQKAASTASPQDGAAE